MHGLRDRNVVGVVPLEKTRSTATTNAMKKEEKENATMGGERRVLRDGGVRMALADHKNVPVLRKKLDVDVAKAPLRPLASASSSASTQPDAQPEPQPQPPPQKALDDEGTPRAYSSFFGDEETQFLEYVPDIYTYLLHLEKRQSLSADFLKGEVSGRHRAILVDWIVQVHTRFHLLPETLHLTVLLLDRYLQTGAGSKKELQLIGVTCMFIASKYEEVFTPELNDFVYVTDNTSSKKDILRMEMKILSALDFDIGRPHSIHFLRRLSLAAKVPPNTHLLAKYLCELALVDLGLCWILPSRLAASALHLAYLLHALPVPELIRRHATAEHHLHDAAMFARLLLRLETGQCKQQAVRVKFTKLAKSVADFGSPEHIDLLTRLSK